MDSKGIIRASAITGISIIIFGFLLKGGIDNFTNKDRRVTVKGLSEVEVPADRVTWSIAAYRTGNDLPGLYREMTATVEKVTDFLKANGIQESEISINPPDVDDRISNRYSNEYIPFNYKLTTRISVTSHNVGLVKDIIGRQGELISQGIALGGYNSINYEYTGFQDMKPKMMEEAIANAQSTAKQFTKNSGSRLHKIITADQGQFSIYSKDDNPSMMKVRVVSTITYSLKD